ncbi:hypothetical protein E2562_023731 [Oryza meyeriana var. granulata]|uniref:Uncharacterized protein n=1 Tax=Oryza meyeriana var. granulata TaxID=110450 RepID=A0A6G1DMK1_9ORYZ|nr:hypothetical protein E2562_023731 [Oryza meyeriana var. granulata]
MIRNQPSQDYPTKPFCRASAQWRRCWNLRRKASGWCLDTTTSLGRSRNSFEITASMSCAVVDSGALMAQVTAAVLSHSHGSASVVNVVRMKHSSSSRRAAGSPSIAITVKRDDFGGCGRWVFYDGEHGRFCDGERHRFCAASVGDEVAPGSVARAAWGLLARGVADGVECDSEPGGAVLGRKHALCGRNGCS